MTVALTPDQDELRAGVRALVEGKIRPRATEIDRRGEFPEDVRRLFAEADIFATTVPEAYGGIDGSLLTLCAVCEEITRVCASSGMVLGNQALGAGPIALHGSAEQRERWLPRLASGEALASFALTEPDAGSDAAGIRTTAVPDGGGWRLSGRKVFITHANVADVVTVFARVPGRDRGISAFLLERGVSDWEVDKIEHKMGLRGSPTCSMVLDDVHAPADALLGEAGEGVRIALSSLNKGRIMTAALALGIAQGALELAVSYAREREQFGKPIGQFQAVGALLADMDADVEATRALVRSAAGRYDDGDGDIVRLSATTKLFATEMVNRVTSSAVQVLGGYGYIQDYPAERMMRDARVFSIFEGTNQIQRLVISRELLRAGARS